MELQKVSVWMLTIALYRASTSPEEGLKATVCASIAQLSSACVGHTADREDGAKPGVTARLQHGSD